MKITAFRLAERFVGIEEIPSTASKHQILAMLRLYDDWPEGDSVPWCSRFMNYIAWLLRLPRSKNLRARSWLEIGRPIDLTNAQAAFDTFILKRSGRNQPGPHVIKSTQYQ